MIHADIPTKYHKYTSTTILKHVNVLAKLNKPPWGRLHNMTPNDTYIITIHVLTMTLADISHKKKGVKPRYPTNRTVRKITQPLNYAKTFMCDLSSDVNHTPKNIMKV